MQCIEECAQCQNASEEKEFEAVEEEGEQEDTKALKQPSELLNS